MATATPTMPIAMAAATATIVASMVEVSFARSVIAPVAPRSASRPKARTAERMTFSAWAPAPAMPPAKRPAAAAIAAATEMARMVPAADAVMRTSPAVASTLAPST